jgi:hypothetical protein
LSRAKRTQQTAQCTTARKTRGALAVALGETENLRMKRIFFFSTAADIQPVLKRLQGNAPLKFVDTGVFETPNRPIYLDSGEIPNLGFSTHETGSLSKAYMASLRDTMNHMHVYTTNSGEKRWSLRNSDTEGTVILTPAGLWKTMLLPGNMSTLHKDGVSQQLMKWFQSALKAEGFIKADIWWLGKEALQMLNSGSRLSKTAEQSPPEFDLLPNEVKLSPNKSLNMDAPKDGAPVS